MNYNHHITQCIWIINTIYQAGSITYAELEEAWSQSEINEGLPLNRTKFNRLRDSIQSLFGIVIECRVKGGYKYYIHNEEDIACIAASELNCTDCPCRKMTAEFFLCMKQKVFMTKYLNV